MCVVCVWGVCVCVGCVCVCVEAGGCTCVVDAGVAGGCVCVARGGGCGVGVGWDGVCYEWLCVVAVYAALILVFYL